MEGKTAIWQAIKDLESKPNEMVSQKSIAGWLQAVYLKVEKKQIVTSYTNGMRFMSSSIGIEENKEYGEHYYNKTYNQ